MIEAKMLKMYLFQLLKRAAFYFWQSMEHFWVLDKIIEDVTFWESVRAIFQFFDILCIKRLTYKIIISCSHLLKCFKMWKNSRSFSFSYLSVTLMFPEHILAKSWLLFIYRQQVKTPKAEILLETIVWD